MNERFRPREEEHLDLEKLHKLLKNNGNGATPPNYQKQLADLISEAKESTLRDFSAGVEPEQNLDCDDGPSKYIEIAESLLISPEPTPH